MPVVLKPHEQNLRKYIKDFAVNYAIRCLTGIFTFIHSSAFNYDAFGSGILPYRLSCLPNFSYRDEITFGSTILKFMHS